MIASISGSVNVILCIGFFSTESAANQPADYWYLDDHGVRCNLSPHLCRGLLVPVLLKAWRKSFTYSCSKAKKYTRSRPFFRFSAFNVSTDVGLSMFASPINNHYSLSNAKFSSNTLTNVRSENQSFCVFSFIIARMAVSFCLRSLAMREYLYLGCSDTNMRI